MNPTDVCKNRVTLTLTQLKVGGSALRVPVYLYTPSRKVEAMEYDGTFVTVRRIGDMARNCIARVSADGNGRLPAHIAVGFRGCISTSYCFGIVSWERRRLLPTHSSGAIVSTKHDKAMYPLCI
jgi:hypothetical protein